MTEQGLTHFDESGRAVMVDVSAKSETDRTALAEGSITMSAEALQAVREGTVKKGDVLGVARIAGIMALKRTAELIPLCHVLPLDSARIEFEIVPDANRIDARCEVKNHGKTGVEMEALTGVSVALLAVYDMVKAIDKRMVISDIHLVSKTGGKSGEFRF